MAVIRSSNAARASWLIALAVIGFWLANAPLVLAEDEYSFGVVPQFEPRKLFATWKPILDELEKRTGMRLKMVAIPTITEFEREFGAGSYDFAYSNPYQYLRLGERQGYIPLVRDEIPLQGILVVPKDSPIKKVEELNGKVLAVPSTNALGASLLMRADLERIFNVKMRLLNAKSHSSVYLHVVNGLVDAGGGVQKTLEEQPAPIRDALRILYTTRNMSSHPVSAHQRVPEEVRNKLRAALLDIGTTPAGAALLAEVPMLHAVPATVQDYQPLASWGLEDFWVEAP